MKSNRAIFTAALLALGLSGVAHAYKPGAGGRSHHTPTSAVATSPRGAGHGDAAHERFEAEVSTERTHVSEEDKVRILTERRIDAANFRVLSFVNDTRTSTTATQRLGNRYSSLTHSKDALEAYLRTASGTLVFLIAHIEGDDIVVRSNSGVEEWRMPLDFVYSLEQEYLTPIVVFGCGAGAAQVSGTVDYINTLDAISNIAHATQGTKSIKEVFDSIANPEFKIVVRDTTIHAIDNHEFAVIRAEVSTPDGKKGEIYVYLHVRNRDRSVDEDEPRELASMLLFWVAGMLIVGASVATATPIARRFRVNAERYIQISYLLLAVLPEVAYLLRGESLAHELPMLYAAHFASAQEWLNIMIGALVIGVLLMPDYGKRESRRYSGRELSAQSNEGHYFSQGFARCGAWIRSPTISATSLVSTLYSGARLSIPRPEGHNEDRTPQTPKGAKLEARKSLSALCYLYSRITLEQRTFQTNVVMVMRPRLRLWTAIVAVALGLISAFLLDDSLYWTVSWVIPFVLGLLCLALHKQSTGDAFQEAANAISNLTRVGEPPPPPPLPRAEATTPGFPDKADARSWSSRGSKS